jgi:hypothetical protein
MGRTDGCIGTTMNSTNTSPVDVYLEYMTEDHEFIDSLGKSVIGRG